MFNKAQQEGALVGLDKNGNRLLQNGIFISVILNSQVSVFPVKPQSYKDTDYSL